MIWIGHPNPWHLAKPPDHWLRAVEAYDPELRIFPGLTEPVYRVGRRSAKVALFKPAVPDGETARMYRHRCLPITSLVPFCAWDDAFLIWLRRHDTWSLGGRDRAGALAADRLDELDRDRAAAMDAAEADEAEQRALSGYLGFKVRRGEVVGLEGRSDRSRSSAELTG